MLSPDAPLTDVEDLAAWKVNAVRVPLYWSAADTQDETAYFHWLEQALSHTDQIIEVCGAHGIRVLLDLHSPPGGYATREAPAQYRVFSELWAQRALVKTWSLISRRYKDNRTVWGFELVNEPALRKLAPGLKTWPKLAREVAKAIRTNDKRHHIVINPIFGDLTRIRGMKPLRMRKVAYSVHMYYPQSFTTQGIGSDSEVRYPVPGFGRAVLSAHLKKLSDFQKKTRSQIFIHEFSVVRWAPSNSAYNYLKDVIDIFEANKWGWFYHAFRESDAWSLEHDTDPDNHEPSPTITDRAELVLSYFALNRKR